MFKWLVVIGVVVLGYVWWKHQRQQEQAERTRAAQRRATPAAPPPPSQMITCRHCGVHLPAGDAVRGAVGLYCSDEHRRLAEG
ncbi:MAG: PP0621 family protein [Tepidimonas sp.]